MLDLVFGDHAAIGGGGIYVCRGSRLACYKAISGCVVSKCVRYAPAIGRATCMRIMYQYINIVSIMYQ